MARVWIYLTVGVVVALIGLGALAINTVLNRSETNASDTVSPNTLAYHNKTTSNFQNLRLTTQETLLNYPLQKAAELQKKVCITAGASFDLSSITEDQLTEDDKEQWFPKQVNFAYLKPQNTVLRIPCFMYPGGFHYEDFYLIGDEPLPIDSTNIQSLFQVTTAEQAIEYIMFFKYGAVASDDQGHVFIISNEDYEEMTNPKNCKEEVQPKVKALTLTELEDSFVVEMNLVNMHRGSLEYQKILVMKEGQLKVLDAMNIGGCSWII